MKTVTLEEMDWRDLLCPLEKVKKWKSGFSIKCPRQSMVGWTKNLDHAIRKELKIKRTLPTCERCQKEMKEFLER